jgi:DNA repair protein RecO (recombination protein O)
VRCLIGQQFAFEFLMPLIESESLVLKSYSLAEADRIVVFFSREQGVIRGVAKGAKRLKSRFGSAFEPLAVVRLTYFQKEDRELVSIQDVELLRSNFAAASDPAYLDAFSYMTDLLITFAPPHDPNEKLYRMARACIEAPVNGAFQINAVRLYFEYWILRLAGFLPDIGRCRVCAKQIGLADESLITSSGHVACGNCGAGSGDQQKISPSERDVFHNVQNLSPADFVGYAEGRGPDVETVSAVLRRLIAAAVGRPVASSPGVASNNIS